MSAISCKYHPDQPARWGCHKCHINYCTACVRTRPGGAATACPVCEGPLASLGAGNVITPFWHRLPRFFLYPANTVSLVLMLLLAAVTALSSVSFLGFVVQLVVIIVFVKYAYAVLEHTAKGHDSPPDYSGAALTGELELPFKQLLVFFVFAFANFAIYDLFGTVAYAASLLLTLIAIPASVMVLAIEHSFFSAFNPMTLGSMILRIGFPYLILCVFLAFLLGGSEIALQTLLERVPDWALFPLYNFLEMYFLLIMFALMGYVIYQYHEELGYPIEVEPESDNEGAETPVGSPGESLLGRVEILIKEGKFEQALAVLERGAESAPTDFPLRDRLHKLLLARGETERLVKHGRDYVARLLRERRPRHAMAVFRDCHQVDPACKPTGAGSALQLAQAMIANGEPRLALSLLSNFHVAYPQAKEIPQAYLLAAHVMCDKYNQDAQAMLILDYLLAHYSAHPLAAEIRAYRETVRAVSDPSVNPRSS